MAMTAQEYLDTFNAAINAGAYDSAANILKAAEGDFGPGVYDVAGVVLESNPNRASTEIDSRLRHKAFNQYLETTSIQQLYLPLWLVMARLLLLFLRWYQTQFR
jgi:hypothetical protein